MLVDGSVMLDMGWMGGCSCRSFYWERKALIVGICDMRLLEKRNVDSSLSIVLIK